MPAFDRNDVIPLKEAAALAGRSVTWVRRKRDYGPLVGAKLNGRCVVMRDSLSALLARGRRKSRPQLRLVVDNTK